MNRIVQLPPVQAFGHSQADKWMLLKNLEESAELVEAGKQYLKEDSPSERVMLREAMLGEWADVLQTLVNTAVAFGFTVCAICHCDPCRCTPQTLRLARMVKLPRKGQKTPSAAQITRELRLWQAIHDSLRK